MWDMSGRSLYETELETYFNLTEKWSQNISKSKPDLVVSTFGFNSNSDIYQAAALVRYYNNSIEKGFDLFTNEKIVSSSNFLSYFLTKL